MVIPGSMRKVQLAAVLASVAVRLIVTAVPEVGSHGWLRAALVGALLKERVAPLM
jgi:hypothetical protein